MYLNLNDYFRKYKYETAIVLVIILVYLPAFYFFDSHRPVRGEQIYFQLNSIDSGWYVKLADNLIEHGVFSPSFSAPYAPETFRTPGYPVFLAAIRIFTSNLMVISLLQMIVTIFCCILIYRIGQLFTTPVVALITSLLFALDPTTIYMTAMVFSDILFIAVFFLSLFLLLNPGTPGNLNRLLALGVTCGILILIRPIAMFLPPVYCVYILWQKRPVWNRRIILYLLAVAVIVMPWVARNKMATGIWGISTVGIYNFYNYYIPKFIAYKHKIGVEEARRVVAGPLNDEKLDTWSLASSDKMAGRVMVYLSQYPVSYTYFHVVRSSSVLLSSSLKEFMGVLGMRTDYNADTMSDLLVSGEFRRFFAKVRDQALYSTEKLTWAAAAVLSVLNVVIRRREKMAWLFFSLICYFIFLTGPTAALRYRLPFEPLLFLLSFDAIYRLFPHLRRKLRLD